MIPHPCSRAWVDIALFAPTAGSSQSAGARQRFEAALAAYAAAYAAGDKDEAVAQRALVEAYRTNACVHCSNVGQLSPTARACDDIAPDGVAAIVRAGMSGGMIFCADAMDLERGGCHLSSFRCLQGESFGVGVCAPDRESHERTGVPFANHIMEGGGCHLDCSGSIIRGGTLPRQSIVSEPLSVKGIGIEARFEFSCVRRQSTAFAILLLMPRR